MLPTIIASTSPLLEPLRYSPILSQFRDNPSSSSILHDLPLQLFTSSRAWYPLLYVDFPLAVDRKHPLEVVVIYQAAHRTIHIRRHQGHVISPLGDSATLSPKIQCYALILRKVMSNTTPTTSPEQQANPNTSCIKGLGPCQENKHHLKGVLTHVEKKKREWEGGWRLR